MVRPSRTSPESHLEDGAIDCALRRNSSASIARFHGSRCDGGIVAGGRCLGIRRRRTVARLTMNGSGWEGRGLLVARKRPV